MKTVKILYAEDDETLAFLTKDNLELNGFNVACFADGASAFSAFNKNHFDICIFDVMMPKLNGFDLAALIREVNKSIPILFLTAKTLKEDKLKGLRLGADDYLIKPFSIEELILKIEIFLKRSQVNSVSVTKVLTIGSATFDSKNLMVKWPNRAVALTQRESDLLSFLLSNQNQIITRESILNAIWGTNDYFMGRSLDVFISRLRKILEVDPSLKIENIHGIGFRFSTK